MIVAEAPESALVRAADGYNGEITPHRDFTSEIVTHSIKPVKGIDFYNAYRNYMNDIGNKAKPSEAFSKSFNISPYDIHSDIESKNIYSSFCK